MFEMREVHSISGQLSGSLAVEIPSAIIETFAVDANSYKIYFVDSKTKTLDELDLIFGEVFILAPIPTGKGY